MLVSPWPKQEGHKLLGPNSKFCKPLKNNSEGCPSNQVSAAAMTSTSEEKWRPFNCFFSRVGLRTYQHPCTWLNGQKDIQILVFILLFNPLLTVRHDVTFQDRHTHTHTRAHSIILWGSKNDIFVTCWTSIYQVHVLSHVICLHGRCCCVLFVAKIVSNFVPSWGAEGEVLCTQCP